MKINIFGSVASGKTTLSKQIATEFDIPHIELDNIVHERLSKEKSRTRSNDEIYNILSEYLDNGSFISEGTPRESTRFLFDACDYIVFLDLPSHILSRRIFTRWLKQKVRFENWELKPDLYHLKLFYKWHNDFNTKHDLYIEELSAYADKFVVFNDFESAYSFVKDKLLTS